MPADRVLVAEPVVVSPWAPFTVFCEMVEDAVVRVNRHCRKLGLRRHRRLWCDDFTPRKANKIAYGRDVFTFVVFGIADDAR